MDLASISNISNKNNPTVLKGYRKFSIDSNPYSCVFNDLVNDCSEVIIHMINEAFGEKYTTEDEIIFKDDIYLLNKVRVVEDNLVTDYMFTITNEDDISKNYHMQFEETIDGIIRILIFERDFKMEYNDKGVAIGLNVKYNNSVLFLIRGISDVKDTIRMRIITSDTNAEFDLPVINVQKYTIEDLFNKNLQFFLKFYI